ncbi:MAG: SDR family NAD(P)-dependent oxidoreductase [Opitutales bacterium]|nr:SDR family NAD(P)-dependent oxidoreductase [Opitutales bacterium]
MTTYQVAITGSDRGLGLELCKAFARGGHTVFAGQYMPDADSLAELQQQYPNTVFPIALDCASDVSIKHFVGETYKHTPRLEILLNNAAVLGDIETGIASTLDFDEMQKVFNINALGPLRLVNALLPLLKAGSRKRIAYISSEAASISENFRDRWFAYCMSKAALNRQAALIHEALKSEDFSVLCLHPGHLRTHMRGELDESASLTAEAVAKPLMELILNPPKSFGFWDFEGKEMGW